MTLQMITRFHNQMVIDDLEEGDLIEINRGLYSHWAIYNGNEQVIHLAGNEDRLVPSTSDDLLFTICGVQYNRAVVKQENLWRVVGNDRMSKNNQHDSTHQAFSPREILQRARSRIGPVDFNAVWNNCEHFVSWCRYGQNISRQAETFLTGVAVAGTMAVVGGLLKDWFNGKDD